MRIAFIYLLTTFCAQPMYSFQAGGAVLGHVFEIGPGSPVAEATVIARNHADGSETTTITAADGTFFIAPLVSGLYSIRVTCEGFLEAAISGYQVQKSRSAPMEPAQIGVFRTGAARPQASSIRRPSKPAVIQDNAAETGSLREAHIRWDSEPGQPGPNRLLRSQSSDINGFSLLESRQTSGSLPRQRTPELSPEQILVVVTDEQDQQKDWMLIPNPRIVRVEGPDSNGELTGEVLYRSSAEFLVPVSSDLVPAILKFYQPRWTGKAFALNLLGAVALQ